MGRGPGSLYDNAVYQAEGSLSPDLKSQSNRNRRDGSNEVRVECHFENLRLRVALGVKVCRRKEGPVHVEIAGNFYLASASDQFAEVPSMLFEDDGNGTERDIEVVLA